MLRLTAYAIPVATLIWMIYKAIELGHHLQSIIGG